MHEVIQVEKGRAGIHRKHKPLNLEHTQSFEFFYQFPVYWDQGEQGCVLVVRWDRKSS